jgi:pimeloyl-ACP methyl ester carboxylesterase
VLDCAHRIRLRDGAELAFEVHDFTGFAGPGKPVILLHGFSKNRKFWHEWVPDLARRYAVVSVDLRGHGNSSMPTPDFEMSVEPFALDLVELVDALGCSSAHFVAAEFACAVGIELATHHKQVVRSMTVAGFGYDFRPFGSEFLAWAKLVEDDGSAAWAQATNELRLPADADERLKRWYVEQQARVPPWLLAKVFRYAHKLDLTDMLPHIAAPTLILSGSSAVQIPLTVATTGAALIPNAKLVVIDNSPSNVMNARPRECVEATLDFLQKLNG